MVVQICVVVPLVETRLLSQVRETCLLVALPQPARLPPLLLVPLMFVVVVCHLLCVCAVITKKHKVESPAKNH